MELACVSIGFYVAEMTPRGSMGNSYYGAKLLILIKGLV